MKKRIFAGLVVSLSLLLAGAFTAAAAEVHLWGSTTCQKRFLEPGAKALEEATGVKIKVFGVGTGKGVLALFEGKTNVAISSNELEGSVYSAHKVRKEDGLPPINVPEGLQGGTLTHQLFQYWLELLLGFQQPAFSFHVHPGHGLNTSRNSAPAEKTRSLVPRLPFRDILGQRFPACIVVPGQAHPVMHRKAGIVSPLHDLFDKVVVNPAFLLEHLQNIGPEQPVSQQHMNMGMPAGIVTKRPESPFGRLPG